MFPICLLTIRTPRVAGDWPTVPMLYCSSTKIFKISWAIFRRSSAVLPGAERNSSSALRSCGSFGALPCVPPLAYQRAMG